MCFGFGKHYVRIIWYCLDTYIIYHNYGLLAFFMLRCIVLWNSFYYFFLVGASVLITQKDRNGSKEYIGGYHWVYKKYYWWIPLNKTCFDKLHPRLLQMFSKDKGTKNTVGVLFCAKFPKSMNCWGHQGLLHGGSEAWGPPGSWVYVVNSAETHKTRYIK